MNESLIGEPKNLSSKIIWPKRKKILLRENERKVKERLR